MDYLQVAEIVVDRAHERNVDAEAFLTARQESDVLVDRGKVEKLSEAASKGLGVRVILRDGKMGYAYTSDFSADSLEETVEAAITLAEVADADEYRRLPDPAPIEGADLEIYDPDIAQMSTEDKVDCAKEIEEAALSVDERVVLTNRCTFFSTVSDVYLVSTRGVSGHYGKTVAGGYLRAMAQDGDERAMAFDMHAASTLAALDPVAIGEGAGRKAVGLLGGRPAPTQKASVVYSPYAAAGLLAALARALTGRAMQRNRSFLQGKMGQTVASDVVTLVDNGRLPGGLGTRSFDDEGVPTAATRLIDEGVLQAVLYDTYSAEREGTQSTGNASRRSHREVPTVMPSNFYVQPGPDSPESVIAGVERGLYVENVMNMHSINPVSGDYSVSAQGYWIEDGELRYPVNEVTIALPLDELLHNVRAVANDLTFYPFFGAIGAPTIRVDGVMIGGRQPDVYAEASTSTNPKR